MSAAGQSDQAASAAAGADELMAMIRERLDDHAPALGRLLLALRERSPHGTFRERLVELGISKSSAAEYMKVAEALEVSNVRLSGHLKKDMILTELGSEALATLDAGGEVRGLSLEKVRAMTVRQLRDAVRCGVRTDGAASTPISVYANTEQHEAMRRKAEQLRLSLSEFLVRLGVGAPLPGPLDFVAREAVAGIYAANADQARIGNLLKWELDALDERDLDAAARRNLESLHDQVRATQDRLKAAARAVLDAVGTDRLAGAE